IELRSGSRLEGSRGRTRVASVEVVVNDGSRRERIACDAVAVSGGWNPAAQLYGQAGGKLRFDPRSACLIPDNALASIRAVGAAAGRFEPRSALQHAAETAAAAVGALGFRA